MNLASVAIMCAMTAMEPAYVVAMYDIERYVYVFFRELALESTALCDKTYYSRVARLCKVPGHLSVACIPPSRKVT